MFLNFRLVGYNKRDYSVKNNFNRVFVVWRDDLVFTSRNKYYGLTTKRHVIYQSQSTNCIPGDLICHSAQQVILELDVKQGKLTCELSG